MYEQIVTYITAIAPSLATVITAILMFVKIIASTRSMVTSLKDDTQKKLKEAMDSQYATMCTLKEEVKKVTDSNEYVGTIAGEVNEIAQLKEQYKLLLADMEEVMKTNAELVAKLNQRGY